MKFLETITAFGNDVLVPIKDIQLVWITQSGYGNEIHIKGKGEWEWVECFGKNEEKLNKRYEMIKRIVNGEKKFRGKIPVVNLVEK